MSYNKNLDGVKCKICTLEDTCFECKDCSLVVCVECGTPEGTNDIVCMFCTAGIVKCKFCDTEVGLDNIVHCVDCKNPSCSDCADENALGFHTCPQCEVEVLVRQEAINSLYNGQGHPYDDIDYWPGQEFH